MPKRLLVKIIGEQGFHRMGRETIDSSFQQLYGNPCWGLRYDRQLNLSMNFGVPSLDIREPFTTDSSSETVQQMAARRRVTVRGEWFLWIYQCYWSLNSAERQLATGASSYRRIERAMSQLEGQKLVSIAIDPETCATRFAFDLGCVLKCRRFEPGSEQELWMLYEPRGFVLSVCGNGQINQQQGTEKARPHGR